MNVVSRRFLGPAGPAFMSRELGVLGVSPESIQLGQLGRIAAHVQRSAEPLMQPAQADEFAEALLACAEIVKHADLPSDPEVGADTAERILEVTTDFLGPAAPAFLARELADLGIAETIPSHLVRPLAERIRHAARAFMDAGRADEFATRVIACGAAGSDGSGRQAVVETTARPAMERGASAESNGHGPALPPVLDTLLMDACRTLRANLSRAETDSKQPGMIVLGTNSHADCGRIAAGLAIATAEEGRSTLLVDTDIESPSVHGLFKVDLANGLGDALRAEVPILMPTPIGQRLSLLTAGRPGEIGFEGQARFGVVARTLAVRFESIVYSATAEAGRMLQVLAPHVRGAVLVVRLGVDQPEAVRAARLSLERAGITILGFAPLDPGSPRRAPRFTWAGRSATP